MINPGPALGFEHTPSLLGRTGFWRGLGFNRHNEKQIILQTVRYGTADWRTSLMDGWYKAVDDWHSIFASSIYDATVILQLEPTHDDSIFTLFPQWNSSPTLYGFEFIVSDIAGRLVNAIAELPEVELVYAIARPELTATIAQAYNASETAATLFVVESSPTSTAFGALQNANGAFRNFAGLARSI